MVSYLYGLCMVWFGNDGFEMALGIRPSYLLDSVQFGSVGWVLFDNR